MHVPLAYHRRVVGILAGALVLLGVLLVTAALDVAPFQVRSPGDQYLQDEEVVVIEPKAAGEKTTIIPVEKVLFEYIEVVDGCTPYFEGVCLNVRSGPGEDYPVAAKLRNGIVLKVGGKVERDGRTWYKVVFDEWIRYPERITGDWYVAADYVRELLDEGNRDLADRKNTTSVKRIVVSRSEQMLYAYDGEELFMREPISTGIELTPTPAGTFAIFKKTPSRYMQGPIPGLTTKYYDLPGVPWNLYFTPEGAVIHGTYWHTNFGRPSSNGCVNLPPAKAEELYRWADVGTKVIVRD